MTSSLNYQSAPGFAESSVWATGNKVLARDGSLFPPRCIKCNSPDNLKWKIRQLTWAPPYLYVVLLIGVIPALIILMLLQRKAKVQMAVCTVCRKKVRMRALIAWGIFLLSVVSIVLAIALDKGVIAIAFPILFLGAIIYGIIACRYFTVSNIDTKGVVTLKGLCPAFVGALDRR